MINNIKDYMQTLGKNAREASFLIAKATTQQKNNALLTLADLILSSQNEILSNNNKDVENAKVKNISAAMLDRLTLTPKIIATMAEGVRQIATLPDPIGEMSDFKMQSSGINVGKMRVPLGVIGIIYEARPNVTIDAAALCLKSGNATILRGGSEAFFSNQFLANLIQQALQKANLPENAVQFIQTPDRQAVSELITMRDFVDVIVPRGGKGLIAKLLQECRVPMIQHLDGNCHVYIEKTADFNKAIKILENAKTQRYGTCNTAENVLIDSEIAEKFLPNLVEILCVKHNVELRCCQNSYDCLLQNTTNEIAKNYIKLATENDFYEEFLAPIIAVKIIKNGVNEAICHINKYSSKHSEAIVSENFTAIQKFLREIDSSSVMVNASTRFADGFEYGLGAEIGISTDKIHARGPVGLLGLTSQKWIVFGDENGSIRN